MSSKQGRDHKAARSTRRTAGGRARATAQAPARTRSGQPTLTREDWLSAAVEALEHGGIEGVHVLALSRALGVSRGSFYWHFRDRRALLRTILGEWEADSSDRLIASIEAESSSASDRIWALMQPGPEVGGRSHDAAIRAWAHYDKEAARFVARVDRRRLQWLEGLFRGLGFPSEQSRVRARLLGVYLIGTTALFARQPRARADRETRAQFRLLTTR